MLKTLVVLSCILLLAGYVFAEEIVVKVSLVNENGAGKEIGTITASDSAYGLILTLQLSELAPGLHGFHVHDKPDCSHAMKDDKEVPAPAAGGHYDPANTGKHEVLMEMATSVIYLLSMPALMERQPFLSLPPA